ncbi:hypothetical protein BJ912DRAFT_485011 [Pholiota molesta]|nr:hypothetical protein BJ912DRAFT_485011 [Pholiota molesta]
MRALCSSTASQWCTIYILGSIQTYTTSTDTRPRSAFGAPRTVASVLVTPIIYAIENHLRRNATEWQPHPRTRYNDLGVEDRAAQPQRPCTLSKERVIWRWRASRTRPQESKLVASAVIHNLQTIMRTAGQGVVTDEYVDGELKARTSTFVQPPSTPFFAEFLSVYCPRCSRSLDASPPGSSRNASNIIFTWKPEHGPPPLASTRFRNAYNEAVLGASRSFLC